MFGDFGLLSPCARARLTGCRSLQFNGAVSVFGNAANTGGIATVGRSTLFSLSFIAFMALAGPAQAVPKIIVFPVVPLTGQAEAGPAGQMTRAIFDELKQQQEKVQAIEGQEPTAAVTTPDTARKPARSDVEYRAALGQLKEGAKQAQKLRFPQAIRALRKGIDDIVKNLDLLDDYNKLIDAYVLLAVSYFRKGQQTAGTDVLEQLARLRPEYELDAAQYPPVFVSVYNQARARALARPRGILHVTSAPAGADVVVNGRSFGKTPILIEEVVPGEHHVVVKLGDNPWGKAVDVREGDTADVHANLGAGGPEASVTMGDAIAANRFDQEVRKTARQGGKNLGADLVLVMAMGMGDRMFTLAGFLGNVKSGKWLALKAVAPDLDMLSDSIEAHTLVREILTRLESFDNPIAEETMPFVSGRPVAAVKRGGGLKEARAIFVSADLKVAAVVDRAPVAVAARTPTAPESGAGGMAPAVLDGNEDAGGSDSRRPIGAREPVKGGTPVATRDMPPPPVPAAVVKPPPPSPEPVANHPTAKPAEPEPRRQPLSRDRGPVMAGDLGIIIDDQPAGAPAGAEPVRPPKGGPRLAESEAGPTTRETIATAAAPAGAAGPLAVPNLEVEATLGQTSIFDEWWFWAVVGGGALVAAGAAAGTVLLINNRAPTSVTVRAVW
jgi:hypothetical protein